MVWLFLSIYACGAFNTAWLVYVWFLETNTKMKPLPFCLCVAFWPLCFPVSVAVVARQERRKGIIE